MKRVSDEELSGVARALAFVRRGQWQVQAERLPWVRRVGLKALRFVTLVADGFKRNQCALHAASLTFYSLMSLVPVLVLALSLARALVGADYVRGQVDTHVDAWLAQFEQSVDVAQESAGEEDGEHTAVLASFTAQVKEVTDKLYTQIEAIHFGTLGGIGLVMLLWTAMGMLGKVEGSFNAVWGIAKSRPWIRKFFDYLGVILILPFLITAVSSVPIASKVMAMMDKTVGGATAATFGQLLNSAFFKTGTTLVFGTLAFAFLLGFMPNGRVKVRSAFAGGFVTIVLFAVWLKICTMLQVGIAKYSALYGGFAVLPILLLWVQMSWQIVLLGAEIAFAAQNRDTYVLEQYATGASLRARLMLALALCAEAARQAKAQGGGPFAAEAFARARGIPHRLVREVLDDLTRNRIFARVADAPGQYLLYKCGDSMTVAEVVSVLLDNGESPATLGLDSLGLEAHELDKTIDDVIEKHLAMKVDQKPGAQGFRPASPKHLDPLSIQGEGTKAT
ncbi:MAG: YihY/virulence factor BrkB family protein [Kiritimatiellaeota bacterium]|nr:YihY/virulence factor BrkB family protein [Kiritimatiellota bacterium]